MEDFYRKDRGLRDISKFSPAVTPRQDAPEFLPAQELTTQVIPPFEESFMRFF